jgi:DNA-binding CsgD family transcriptional regulator
VDWVSYRKALGRPRGRLGIRLGDVGMAAVVLVAVELSVVTGGGPGAAPLNAEAYLLGAVAEGLSNEEIATRLVVSPLTAKTHVSRAMTKLAARDRAQLVVLAYTHGLASPSA